jgi:hypothetical protein
MIKEQVCDNCGHSRSLHEKLAGYQPFGHCNYQDDLCGCKDFQCVSAEKTTIDSKRILDPAVIIQAIKEIERIAADHNGVDDEAYELIMEQTRKAYAEANHKVRKPGRI